MKAELTDAQRAKLASMKRDELQQAVMSRMSLSERMEMMAFVGSDGGMREGTVGAPQ
jgi:hypothetical protein